MSGARGDILGAIRASLGRNGWSAHRIETERARLKSRLADPGTGPIPSRARATRARQPDLFRDMAERAKATVALVSSWAGVPAEIERFLAAQSLSGPIRVAPDPELNELAAALAARLPVGRGPAAPDDATTVTGSFVGIAETGTLMMVSSPAHPTLLNLLAPNHIAVLREDRIVGSYEEAFARLIERLGDKPWPRTVNLITGPSRSADIEQKIQYGAHGPRRLHIVLVGADSGEAGRP